MADLLSPDYSASVRAVVIHTGNLHYLSVMVALVPSKRPFLGRPIQYPPGPYPKPRRWSCSGEPERMIGFDTYRKTDWLPLNRNAFSLFGHTDHTLGLRRHARLLVSCCDIVKSALSISRNQYITQGHQGPIIQTW
jgi:hypothetical protein